MIGTRNISVVICAYTEARWDALITAVTSVQHQSRPPQEIIIVVDHNLALLNRVRAQITGVTAIANREARGLSGARNSGIAVARGEIIAFMDEDATVDQNWLERLSAAYENPKVMGVGGAIEPWWVNGRPPWFPAEFDWVVGCTYLGMPEMTAPVRNLIGCNMSLRRSLFTAVGGFRSGIGRIGTRPVGCEETELCIRAGQQWPQSHFLYEPRARVHHQVPAGRANWRYFLSRCYAEGLSKAQVTQHVGSSDGLASERTYVLHTLPQGVRRGLADTLLRRDPAGLARAAAIIMGLATTTVGYLAGRISRLLAKHNQQGVSSMSSTPHFEPIRILEVEISQPIPDIAAATAENGQIYDRAFAFARLHGRPLGMVDLALDGGELNAAAYAGRIWQGLHEEINAHLQEDGLRPATQLTAAGLPSTGEPHCLRAQADLLAAAPFISVVVATRDRADSLKLCLDALVALDYPPGYEIIVVDNAPKTRATAELIRQRYKGRVRYLREEIPGVSRARNRALAEARGEIVAFTDDDVIVDAGWLTGIARGFAAAENVGCVNGLVVPAQLEKPAQVWFEQYGGFNRGYQQRIYDLEEHHPGRPLYPYSAGIFGTGANMAFTTAVLRKMGGFDPAFGVGSKARGGPDLEAYFQVIIKGYQLVYEPTSLVHHIHRRDYAGLRKQVFAYGCGFTAYITKWLLKEPKRILDIAAGLPYGLSMLFNPRSAKQQQKKVGYPKELTRLELLGMVYGPFAYFHSWQHERRVNASQRMNARQPLRRPPSWSRF